MMVGRELGDYYGKRQLEQGRGGPRGRRTSPPQDGALQPTSLRVHRGEILGVAGLVGSGKAELGMALGGAIPCTGERPRRRQGRRDGRPALDAQRRDRLRPRRPQALGAAADPQRVGELLDRLERAPLQQGRARHARRAPHGARRDHALRGDHRVARRAGSRRSPAATSRRSSSGACSRSASTCSSCPSRPAGSTSARRARSTGSCRRRRRRVPPSSSSPPSCPELLGIADRIVVFYGGEVRGEFSGDGMQEEDIAHVAVTGRIDGPRSADHHGDVMTDQQSAVLAPRGDAPAGAPNPSPPPASGRRACRSAGTRASSSRCSSSRST